MTQPKLRSVVSLPCIIFLIACIAPAVATQVAPPVDTPASVATPSPEISITPRETSSAKISVTPTEEPFQMPDGRLLVYTNLTGEQGGVYKVVSLPSLTVEPYEPLNSNEWFVDWNFVLSPSGHYLAYERSVNRDYARHTLYLLNVETGVSTLLQAGYQSNGKPTWTSDGRFLEFDNGMHGFNIYEIQTGNLRQIRVGSEFSGSSAISPAGNRIAYKGGCPGPLIACPVDLYIVNSDGTGERFVEKGVTDWIFWSADGRLIYYSLFGDRETYGNSTDPAYAGYRFYALDPETGQSSTVDDPRFNTEANDSSFLSPDGQLLAYAFGNAGLKVIRTPDHTLFTLLPPGDPAWSPDSHYIAASSWDGEWYLFDVQTGKSTVLDLGLETSTIVGWLP